MEKNAKIYVAGHNGLVGSALVKKINQMGYVNILVKTKNELNLLDKSQVVSFFDNERPDYVFLAAAKVGGIQANNLCRADFIYENLTIQNNVIHASYVYGVKKLVFLGSSCIYPKQALQPIKEEALLTGPLEYTNEPYAIAKIAGIKLCESYNLQYGTNFIAVMPTNLYGPNDNFDLDTSHVIPAIIRKMLLAKWYNEQNFEFIKKNINQTSKKETLSYLHRNGIYRRQLELWGSGRPLREFLWSEDLADACFHLMKKVDFKDLYHSSEGETKNTHINVGSGQEISIKDLALTIKNILGYQGNIVFDSSKPDGTMRKLLDIEKIHALGWKHKMELEEGLERLVRFYLRELGAYIGF